MYFKKLFFIKLIYNLWTSDQRNCPCWATRWPPWATTDASWSVSCARVAETIGRWRREAWPNLGLLAAAAATFGDRWTSLWCPTRDKAAPAPSFCLKARTRSAVLQPIISHMERYLINFSPMCAFTHIFITLMA